jgi:DNA-binding transcriptional LysR family regulator
VHSAEEELAAIAELRTGTVRVAGFQSVLSTLVIRAAAAMHATAPGIELSLADMHPDDALQRLREGLIDVAIVFRYDETMSEDLRFQHLFDDPMYLLSNEAGQTLAEHQNSAWIAGCEKCRRDLVGACEAAGFTPRIRYTSDDPLVQQSLVAAGLGVTTLPGLSIATQRVDGVQATELDDFRRRVYVATYGEPPDPPATAAFVEAITEAVSTLEVAAERDRELA